jgi:hypothetical protein
MIALTRTFASSIKDIAESAGLKKMENRTSVAKRLLIIFCKQD